MLKPPEPGVASPLPISDVLYPSTNLPKFLPAEDIWVEGGSGVFWIAGQQQNERNRY